MPQIFFLYFVCYLLPFSNGYVLIYHTENSPSVQYFNCIYYKDVKYCHQVVTPIPVQYDFNGICLNDGYFRSFSELVLLNVTVSDVLQWSSSIEQADRYAKYLLDGSLDPKDNYMCNCTNPSTFGKICEYEFFYGSTSFDEAIMKQFKSREDTKINIGSQLHGNWPCYLTFECDMGAICLDWRHICDGRFENYSKLVLLI
jgi:hypothetical protein